MPKKNFDEIVDNNPALAFMSNKRLNIQVQNSMQHDNMIKIELLVPYANHPFKLYEGKRLNDMVNSIREMGVLLPIIVRPVDSDTDQYEILSGHNRVNAAREAGLNEIPAIVKRNLTDDEAKLIVTETNLVQRSFADLLHSEKAVALKYHLDAIKQQGKRTDLINEINNLLNADKTKEKATSNLLDVKLLAAEKTGVQYGLSSASVTRYIRISFLSNELQHRVDNEEIGLYPAVSISYLSSEEQTELNRILDETKYKVDMKKAETLREYSQNKKLTADRIEQILSGEFNKKPKTKSPKAYKMKPKIYAKFFDDTMKHTEVDVIIEKALEEYFSRHK